MIVLSALAKLFAPKATLGGEARDDAARPKGFRALAPNRYMNLQAATLSKCRVADSHIVIASSGKAAE